MHSGGGLPLWMVLAVGVSWSPSRCWQQSSFCFSARQRQDLAFLRSSSRHGVGRGDVLLGASRSRVSQISPVLNSTTSFVEHAPQHRRRKPSPLIIAEDDDEENDENPMDSDKWRILKEASANNFAEWKIAPPLPRWTVSQRPTNSSSSSSSSSTTTTSTSSRSHAYQSLHPREFPYESSLAALQTYHSLHGDLVLPRRFKVPFDDAYSIEWHGIDLASTVYNMKWWTLHIRSHPSRVAELNELGFLWDRLQPEWNLVLEALVTYSSIHGHLRVPPAFVVQPSEEWPKGTWGIALGNAVLRIRNRHDFVKDSWERKRQLDGLGFIWDVNEAAFAKFYRALQHFARNDGGDGGHNGESRKTTRTRRSRTGTTGKNFRPLRVPSTLVIPPNSDWPSDLWHYPLGAKCSAVRQKGLYIKNHPHRQALLQEELGFRVDAGNAALGWLQVVHAAAIYSRMHNKCLDVPINFVVPHDPDGQWPEQLWGLPLGTRLKDIRLKGAYLKGSPGPARRAQLDALGFVWEPKRGRRASRISRNSTQA